MAETPETNKPDFRNGFPIREARALNVGVLAWSPLARGVSSGKYHSEGKTDGGRMSNEGMKELLPEEQRATRIISAVKAVSKQTGSSMPQVALAWMRYQTLHPMALGSRPKTRLFLGSTSAA
jgi:aryl-alcohol dehydrogenase-like predicted oxidoreductase